MRMFMQVGGNIVIDGKKFTGQTISIIDGKVTVDGVDQEGSLVGDINITVEGNIDELENTCGTVRAKNVGSIKTQSGDIICGDVSGSISTQSGDVKCGKIAGSVKTMSGDIIQR